MPKVDWYRKVLQDERVWASTKAQHKMGWVHPGDVIHLVYLYGENWYRIELASSTAPDIAKPSPEYPEIWLKDRPDGLLGLVDTTELPGVTDEELGAALRTILDYLKG